jgi:hypothetical protein
MITLTEMRKRISNKYTVLPLLYSYHLNDIKNECIFYETRESDDETDDLAKQAEETLITLFGHDDFAAFNITCQFIATFEEQEAIHTKITEKWRAKAKAYILDYLEHEQYIKNGYFFMFLPKSL